MNYYQHHIGDFDKATRHLTRIERSMYRDLIELYYDTEQPLTLDRAVLCRKILARSNEEATAVEQTLNEFFTETATGWYHGRCEAEIERYQNSNSQKAQAGKASALKRAAKAQQALNGNPTAVEQTLNGTPTNQEPITNNQYIKTSVNSDKKPSESDPLPCPIEKLVEAYHESMPNNPRCKVLNNGRKAAIRQRWREASTMWTALPFGYESQPDGLTAWRKFFEVCADSDFLTGKVPSRNGGPPFVADVDFLFSPSGFAKVLENKYHREAA